MVSKSHRQAFEAVGFRRSAILGLLALHLGSTVFESIGLTILLPVFQMMQSGADAETLAADNGLWRRLVDVYAAVGVPVTVPTLLATSLAAILARQVFTYFRLVYTSRTRLRLIRGVRERAFGHFVQARLAFGEGDALGQVVNDVTTEAQVGVDCMLAMVSLVGQAILVVIYCAILLALSVPMTLAAAAALGLATIPVLRLMRRAKPLSHEMVVANRNVSGFLVERMKSVRLIRLSGTEAAEREEMGRRAGAQFDKMFLASKLAARSTVIIEPVVIASAFLFLYAGHTYFGLTLEQIGLFVVITMRLLPVIKSIVSVRQSILTSLGSMAAMSGRLRRLADAREEDRGTREMTALRSGIRLEDVTFRHENAMTPALNDVTLEIAAGGVTALVGPSGGGKSTLIDLLPRLREPQSGRILFDGVPASDIRLDSLRAAISYAPQAPQIFNVSAGAHIRYSRPDATLAEVERAAKLAGAHEFIVRLSDGYDTRLGEDGRNLSGGQRQRLDLARALLKGAPILILDEPTSQLDAESEDLLRAALRRIHETTDITVIIVAHRLSTVSVADQIVVLRDGRVVDRGSHVELMARRSWYADAYRRQHTDNHAVSLSAAC